MERKLEQSAAQGMASRSNLQKIGRRCMKDAAKRSRFDRETLFFINLFILILQADKSKQVSGI